MPTRAIPLCRFVFTRAKKGLVSCIKARFNFGMRYQYYSLAEIKRVIEGHPASYYVYLLARPSGQPFYVGCGRIRRESRERIQGHDWLARTRDNSWKSKVILWIWKSGGEVQYRVVGWFNTEASMFACEKSEIRRLGRRDLGLGPLVNGNDGGTGQLNPSVEIREKISQTKRRQFSADPQAALRASLRSKTAMARPEVREKLRRAALKQFSVPGASLAVTRQNLRRFSDPEQRLAAAERARKQMQNAERRALFLKGVNKDREANLRRSIEVCRADPTFRGRMSIIKKAQAVEKAEFRSRIIAAAIALGVNRQDLPANRAPMQVWVEMASRFGVSR